MGFFSKLDKHASLFQGMSQRLGVDFADRIGQAPQTSGDYRLAILSCTSCQCAGACATWRNQHDNADAAPGFCRNKRMLNSLAQA